MNAHSKYHNQLKEKYLAKIPTSARFAEKACRWMPGGDTHGHFFSPPHHIVIKNGTGCYLFDVDDNRYIDCVNGYFSLDHGHCFQPVVEALAQQITSGTQFGMPSETQITFAEHLCERVPSLDMVRFVTSGSEATSMTFRAARAFTGKRKIMKVDGGYHGIHNIGELNSFNCGERRRYEGKPEIGTRGSEIEDVILFPWNDEEIVKKLILEHADQVAALIMEPANTGAMIPATPRFLETIRTLTREKNIVLIFDEVVTLNFSYGGLQTKYGVTPDLTAMGKCIGGGLPVGAWGGSQGIMEMWDPRNEDGGVKMVSTFGGNPMTMAAGMASLTHLTPELIEKRNTLAERLQEELTGILKKLKIRAHASGLAHAFTIYWTDKPVRDLYDFCDARQRLGERVRNLLHSGLRYHGVYLYPDIGGGISTAIEEKDVFHILEAFEKTLTDIYPVMEEDSPDLLM